jgi:aldehyde dehydrogenase (NAD(P)+)
VLTLDPSLDREVGRVATAGVRWSRTSLADRIELLDELRTRFDAVAEPWVRTGLEVEGLTETDSRAGEEWLAGPFLVARQLRLFARTLRALERDGRVPARPKPGSDRVRVLPNEAIDRVFLERTIAEVRLSGASETGSTPPDPSVAEGACLVLGGGNISGIPPTDVLHQLFVAGRPVVLKTHPASERLAPLLEDAFAPLIARGLLAIARGHPDVGRALVEDARIGAIHLTGSARTYEAIVFGEGEEGERRRAAGQPSQTRPVTAELGNVTPLIVVPGAWSNRDLDRQARHVASMLTNNAGFNCAAVRIVVTARRWRQRGAFLDALRSALAAAPPRRPWYPGSIRTYEAVRASHPGHELLGAVSAPDQVPWLYLPDLDPAGEDRCFREEAFGPILAEAGLDAETPAAFLRAAVEFANQRLWGTLAAHLLVHPSGLRDRTVGPEVRRAIDDLRYGTIAVNTWAGVPFATGVTPWGAAPGSTPTDIQSGNGFVHESLLLTDVVKSVVWGPWRPVLPHPFLIGHRTFAQLAERVTRFEARRSLRRLPGIAAAAVRG